MEAIAPDAGVGEMPGQGKGLRDLRLTEMKRRVEAGDLWNVRRHIQDGPDWRQRCLCGLVQGCKWYQFR